MNKLKILFYENNKIEKTILYTVLCIVIVIITYINFVKLGFNEDPDIFAEMTYGKEVWINKNLFPMSWFPAQELMFFRPAIIYILIYGITKKFVLSYSISLTITLLLVIFSYIYVKSI